MLIWGLGEGMFIYLQPLYLQELGASPLAIGSILGAMGIAMTVTHIPAGYLADRVGRRPLMWASWIVGLAAAWAMALAQTLPVFVAGLLTYGVTSFVMAPLNSYITAARGNWSVGRALTTIMAFYNTGAIVGPWLGGRIGEQAGLRPVYLTAACIFVVSTCAILCIRSQPVDSLHITSGKSKLQLDKQFLGFLGVVFWAMLVISLPQPLSSNYLQNVHHLNLEEIGRLGSTASLGIVVLGLTLGRINPRWVFLLAQAAIGMFAFLLWRATSMAWFTAAYFLLGGYRVARTMVIAYTRGMVHQGNMGLAYGITESVGFSATILAPLAAGYLFSQDARLVYPVSLAGIIMSLIISAHFAPRS
jgi:MFS family permease